jgi:hypothetical protein
MTVLGGTNDAEQEDSPSSESVLRDIERKGESKLPISAGVIHA